MEMAQTEPSPSGSLRVAVEGCGHGTLHAIFASVQESCEAKGWDGVDVLLIGGDFQAVRNKHDLNVTAMPPKYRQMADFHEYYSGTRTAPYLTIFIGGNHEASNHLFELYYGGWVAPNIYYLGAANVLRVGNLRMAGLSGIWKGYDYRKPHFERLPYNEEDINSIYHVRELDVRKLLSLRSQVDIGLSHDWPQTIEWHGDHKWLFREKDSFEADANTGRLGSVAARECLERLRPPYWFSAHLHCKYTAIFDHVQGQQYDPEPSSLQAPYASLPAQTGNLKEATDLKYQHTANGTNGRRYSPVPEHQEQISAWNSFGANAQKSDAEERVRLLHEHKDRLEDIKNGKSSPPRYNFVETFKKVTTDDGLNRKIERVENGSTSPPLEPAPIPQLDGCSISRPLKRRRQGTDSPPEQPEPRPVSLTPSQVDGGHDKTMPVPRSSLLENPNAIDVDTSDDEESAEANGGSSVALKATAKSFQPSVASSSSDASIDKQTTPTTGSAVGAEGGVKLNAGARDFDPPTGLSSVEEESIDTGASTAPLIRSNDSTVVFPEASLNEIALSIKSQRSSKSSLRAEARPFNPQDALDYTPKLVDHPVAISPRSSLTAEKQPGPDAVPEDLRAELAALSTTFTQSTKFEPSPTLPFPTEITNKRTHFLALDKCLPQRDFLQLLEVPSITSNDPVVRPVKLHYDPEWLGILRAFAPELKLGGVPTDRIPPSQGETYYRSRIIKEMNWVKENIVDKDLLQVPENFEITAPTYDASLNVKMDEMPREYTNPQTSRFCELIGIENLFDVSEEVRDEMMKKGPRELSERYMGYKRQNRGGRGGRSGGRGGGGGGRGGRAGRGGRGGGWAKKW